MQIEVQHHRHVVLASGRKRTPNAAWHLRSISKVGLGRPKPRSRVLPSPFMPTRLASSPALSGSCQKRRYFGFPDVAPAFPFPAGTDCFALPMWPSRRPSGTPPVPQRAMQPLSISEMGREPKNQKARASSGPSCQFERTIRPFRLSACSAHPFAQRIPESDTFEVPSVPAAWPIGRVRSLGSSALPKYA